LGFFGVVFVVKLFIFLEEMNKAFTIKINYKKQFLDFVFKLKTPHPNPLPACGERG
jgi:hypothetical protein